MIRNWVAKFEGLNSLPTSALAQFEAGASLVELVEGARVFGSGMAPTHFILVVDGCVRVQQMSEQGREIVLYRIRTGDTCALTIACLLACENYHAEAIVERPGHAVVIPRELFDSLVASSSEFRQFVFSSFGQRITGLMKIVEDVAFQRLDIRLSQRLIELADEDAVVNLTHQQLSVELGSAREVISRQLKEFERNGWVELTRGGVRLIDTDAVKKLSVSI